MSIDATAKNLDAIQRALNSHAKKCQARVLEIAMNPFEVERLDFAEFRGIPIVADEKLGTGRVRIICDAMKPPTNPEEITEAIGREQEVLTNV